MAEGKKLETLVYCLGQIGGEHNPVITEGLSFNSKDHYTKKGYARYIEEANNVIKFMSDVLSYFLESVKSEFEEDPLAFIDLESKEDLLASIQKMKTQWKDMFKGHQKTLREALLNQTLEESSKPAEEESASTPKPAAEEDSSEESSSSSSKIMKMDPEAASEATERTSEMESYTYEWTTAEGTTETETTVRPMKRSVPVESLEFPQSIFLKRLKDFGRVIKAEYQELRTKMGKALDRISPGHVAHDLKGFTLQKMEKFAKWKYTLNALKLLVPDLEKNFLKLDLDFDKRKPNEKRLTDWLYFDDGKRDRKYHHRLLIPMELTVSIEEISAIIWRQIRRYRKIKKSLESKLPEEHEAFKTKVEKIKYEVLYHIPMKTPVKVQTSNQSDDTYYGVANIEEDS